MLGVIPYAVLQGSASDQSDRFVLVAWAFARFRSVRSSPNRNPVRLFASIGVGMHTPYPEVLNDGSKRTRRTQGL